MTATATQHPNDVCHRSFWPEGWDHAKEEFHVPLTIVGNLHSNFAKVLRNKNGHAFEVWFGGVGEAFSYTSQAVHHIRLLAREINKQ